MAGHYPPPPPEPDDLEDRRHSPGRRTYDHVSLQYYLERLLSEFDRRIDKLDASMDRLDERQEQYVARAYYDEHHDAVVERLTRIERWLANLQGRGLAIALLGGLLVTALGAWLGHILPT